MYQCCNVEMYACNSKLNYIESDLKHHVIYETKKLVPMTLSHRDIKIEILRHAVRDLMFLKAWYIGME